MKQTLVIACLALLLALVTGCRTQKPSAQTPSNQRSAILKEFEKLLKATTLKEVDFRGMTFAGAVSYLCEKGNQKLHEQKSKYGFSVISKHPEGFKEMKPLDVYMRECSIYDCFTTLAASAGLAMVYRDGLFFFGSPEDVREYPPVIQKTCPCMLSWEQAGWSVDKPKDNIDDWNRVITEIAFSNTPPSEAIMQLQSMANSNGVAKLELSFDKSATNNEGVSKTITFGARYISVCDVLISVGGIGGYHHVAYRGHQAVLVPHRPSLLEEGNRQHGAKE